MRTNVYKDHVLQVLKKRHLLSMKDIHAQVSEANHSTIFRNVEQLVDEGLVKKVVLGPNDTRYELVGSHDEHDHFVCTDCGDIEMLPVSIREHALAALSQTSVSDLLVQGLCKDCNA